jgi:hypothetical protein
MNSSLIALYLIVAGLFFVLGKATNGPEERNSFLAALAALLWPLTVFAVAVCVLYEKRKGAVSRPREGVIAFARRGKLDGRLSVAENPIRSAD